MTVYTQYRRARAHADNARAIAESALQSAIAEAEADNTSLRDLAVLTQESRSTLARRKFSGITTLVKGPNAEYDEDLWIAAEDYACNHDPEQMVDRGPWRKETSPDGDVSFTLLNLGMFAVPNSPSTTNGTITPKGPGYEPLQGITADEYRHALDNPHHPTTDRIIRRLARAVLRTIHTGLPRHGIILDAATAAVRNDVAGAMILAGLASPSAETNDEWLAEVRTRPRTGYYLPAWEDLPG